MQWRYGVGAPSELFSVIRRGRQGLGHFFVAHHLPVEAGARATSEQQGSRRRHEQCDTDIDLLHWEITLFESSSLAHS
jgi:hypothetical protein